MDRKGELKTLNLPPGPYSSPRVSPDGTRIAFGIDDGKEANIYKYELSGGTAMKRVTFGGKNRFPVWLDAKRIAFQSDRDGAPAIFWQPVDSGDAVPLAKPQPGESHAPESWSPKADRLLFSVTKDPVVSLWTYSIQERKATPFGEVHSSYPTGAMFSPDGRWVAYARTERGKTTIYVEPFPSTGNPHQLPAKASDDPHAVGWSPDGRELFYVPRIGDSRRSSSPRSRGLASGVPWRCRDRSKSF
jgi:serine/threonine-protein kinase